MKDIRIYAQPNCAHQRTDLFIFMGGSYVDDVILTEPKDDGTRYRPSLSIPEGTAQMLMDQLWRCGYRPTEARSGAGTVEAMQRHLDDMRNIAFHQLKMKPSE